MLIEDFSGALEQVMHKNRLQEYAQRLAIPLPLYTTVNKGQHHLPQFASSVYVQGMTHHSSQAFRNRKAAEQDAARVALDYLHENKSTIDGNVVSKETEKIGCSSSLTQLQESTLWKSILHECAAILKLEKPSYDTVMTGRPHSPAFSSSVNFSGMIYTGGLARKKNDAEQRAAYKAVETLLSTTSASDTEKVLLEILNSKANHGLIARQKSCGAPMGSANGVSKNAPGSSLVRSNVVKPNACADATQGDQANDTSKFVAGCSFLVQPDEVNHVLAEASRPGSSYGASKCVRGETEKVGFSLDLLKESKFVKLILHEYAAKLKLDEPLYETVKTGLLHAPAFSSVNFAGIIYTGGLAKNKKDAERRAAYKVVESLLSSSSASDAEKIFLEILKSKVKHDHTSGQKSYDTPAGHANGLSNRTSQSSFQVQPDDVNHHACAYASGSRPTNMSKSVPETSFIVLLDEESDHACTYTSGSSPKNSASKSVPESSFVVHLDEESDHACAEGSRSGLANGSSKYLPRGSFPDQPGEVNHHLCVGATKARKRSRQKTEENRTKGIKKKRELAIGGLCTG